MEIKGNVTDRKALVKALSERLGVDACYMGPPSFSYKVGDLTIGREGTVETENEEQCAVAKAVMVELGYLVADTTAVEGLTVQVPTDGMDGIALRNLLFMLSSKQYLLNRVLKVWLLTFKSLTAVVLRKMNVLWLLNKLKFLNSLKTAMMK